MEMINNVVNFPQLPDVTQIKPAPDTPKEVAAPSAGDAAKNDDAGGTATGGHKGPPPYYELQLTIDKDPNTGGWVYKAVDRYTGKVVSQMPQESIQEMQKSETYHAGSVIDSAV
jgi:flagellar protein FlaG